MKRILALSLAVLIIFALIGCAAKAPEFSSVPDPDVDTVKAVIKVADLGEIELELYPKVAPQSVRNFIYLARKGIYEGSIFHRVIPGFMIQGGSADHNGGGSPGYNIKGEFSENGFDNELKHLRGVISCARPQNFDGANSQFFICVEDRPDLDGKYAPFGKVTAGMEVADKIVSVETDDTDRPLTDIVIESVTIDGPEFPEPEMLK